MPGKANSPNRLQTRKDAILRRDRLSANGKPDNVTNADQTGAETSAEAINEGPMVAETSAEAIGVPMAAVTNGVLIVVRMGAVMQTAMTAVRMGAVMHTVMAAATSDALTVVLMDAVMHIAMVVVISDALTVVLVGAATHIEVAAVINVVLTVGAIAPAPIGTPRLIMVAVTTAMGMARGAVMGISAVITAFSITIMAMILLAGSLRVLDGIFIPALILAIAMLSLRRFLGGDAGMKRSRCSVTMPGDMDISNQVVRGLIAHTRAVEPKTSENGRFLAPVFICCHGECIDAGPRL